MNVFENTFSSVLLAETWFAILFTVIVEIVPADVRAVVVGIFLFLMNNIGGNIPILVEPLEDATSKRTALLIMYAGMVGLSKNENKLYLVTNLLR